MLTDLEVIKSLVESEPQLAGEINNFVEKKVEESAQNGYTPVQLSNASQMYKQTLNSSLKSANVSSKGKGNTEQGEKTLDGIQFVLDLVGLVPGFGEVADGANALISLLRGDYVGAALSAAAMIPFAGWAATAGKGAKYAIKAADAIGTVAKYGDEVVDAVGTIVKHGDDVADVVGAVAKYGDDVIDLGETAVKYADDVIDAGEDAVRYADEATDTGKAISKNADDIAQGAGEVKKPYSSRRPKYGSSQVNDVWNAHANPITNTVQDPSGATIVWDRTKPRNGQWDMGHIPGQKYFDIHTRYMKGEISLDEFLNWYRNPQNYRPELPKTNRSRLYEGGKIYPN